MDALAVIAYLAMNSRTEGDCLVWTGGRSHGYGAGNWGRRRVGAHQLAWIARHGPIPPETPCVLHRCDNPPCIRDEHLWLGTHADNNADMIAKGRGRNGYTGRDTCSSGHEYTEANTRVTSRGWRYCRACDRIRTQAYKERLVHS